MSKEAVQRKPWSTENKRFLRKNLGRMPCRQIARKLRRTEGAVRQYAFQSGFSTKMR